MRHILVIGGGFAGLRVVRGLRGSPVRVTLVDRTNHHCFQPLLYQLATGGLSPGEIAPPLRWVLRGQSNADVVLGDAYDIDLDAGRVQVRTIDGATQELDYDHLVVATGARHSYFGHDEWATHAPGLKSVEDALHLRNRIFEAFERADASTDEAERRRLLTFVVVGAGPTGVELAGQIVEIARATLRREYRNFDPADSRTVLIDAGPRVLASFDEALSEHARRALDDMGVEVRTGVHVTDVDANGVHIGDEQLAAGTVVWAAGVAGSELGAVLTRADASALDRSGRVHVDPADLTLPGHPNVHVLGDLAATGLPGVAPVAMQQGSWVARSIDRSVRGASPPQPFRYRDHGVMATIGRRRAVAHIGRFRFGGTLAWLMWLFIHLLYLVGFANRVLVLIRWLRTYLTSGRGERMLSPSDTESAPTEPSLSAP